MRRENMSILQQAQNSSWITPKIDELLHDFDDGELYLEETEVSALTWDNDKIKNASLNKDSGFGLRAVSGELVGYAHSPRLDEQSLNKAIETVKLVKSSKASFSEALWGKHNLYQPEKALADIALTEQIDFIKKVDAYIRKIDTRIERVNISLVASHQSIGIYRPQNGWAFDERPLIRFNISVILKQGERRENGSAGFGSRQSFHKVMGQDNWQNFADKAVLMASVNMEAIEAPAGEMSVVLGSGWPGVLLHEAVGHGLEGDFNRKKTSAFSSLMGQQVAAKGVTVVDQGNIPHLRGSLNMDDEGTATNRTVLIEDGILKGYMQDRQNAQLMNVAPTGNGRRQSYAHIPMPRMTNTFMENGHMEPEEIIASLDKGIYAESFGGGQVDITSGQFVFSCTQAWLIEKGKKVAPLKGATLIGSGPESLKHISMIGNDTKLDDGVGTCGKAGQSVPVGVGQPTLRIENMVVGGQSL